LQRLVKIWKRRLLCCFGRSKVLKESEDELQELSEMLARYFQDFNWAPSDILVGLITLKKEQKKILEIKQARRLVL
jgi:hypothetical protein